MLGRNHIELGIQDDIYYAVIEDNANFNAESLVDGLLADISYRLIRRMSLDVFRQILFLNEFG